MKYELKIGVLSFELRGDAVVVARHSPSSLMVVRRSESSSLGLVRVGYSRLQCAHARYLQVFLQDSKEHDMATLE